MIRPRHRFGALYARVRVRGAAGRRVRVLRRGVPVAEPDGRPAPGTCCSWARAPSAPAAAHADRGRSVAAGARGLGAHQPPRCAVGAAALARRRRRQGARRRPETLGLAPAVSVDRDRPGELAPGLAGDWLADERVRHRERSSRGLAAAASALEADGDLAGAAARAQERVGRDPPRRRRGYTALACSAPRQRDRTVRRRNHRGRPRRQTPEVEVEMQNQGESTENGITVSVTVSGGGTLQGTIKKASGPAKRRLCRSR